MWLSCIFIEFNSGFLFKNFYIKNPTVSSIIKVILYHIKYIFTGFIEISSGFIQITRRSFNIYAFSSQVFDNLFCSLNEPFANTSETKTFRYNNPINFPAYFRTRDRNETSISYYLLISFSQ